MRYHAPYGNSDPDAGYVNGDPSIARAGSIPPAECFEYPQREIVNALTAAGLTPSDTDLTQLWQAMQRIGGIRYSVDSGSENTVLATPIPAVTSYFDGLPLLVKVAVSNTGPSTINVNGVGVVPIKRKGNALLQGNDLVATSVAFLVFVTDRFELINSTGPTGTGGDVVVEGAVVGGSNIGAGDGSIFAGISGDNTIWFRTIEHGSGITVATAGDQVTIALSDMGSDLTVMDPTLDHFAVTRTQNLGDAHGIDARLAFMYVLSTMGAVSFTVSESPPTDRTGLWWHGSISTAKRYNPILGNWFALTASQMALYFSGRVFGGATSDTAMDTGDLLSFWDASVGETKTISRENLLATLGILRTLSTQEGIKGGGNLGADRTLSLDIPGLALLASPDPTADKVAVWDDSAGQHKSVLLSVLLSALTDDQLSDIYYMGMM